MHSNGSNSKIFQETFLDLIFVVAETYSNIRDVREFFYELFFIFIRFKKKNEHQFNTQAQ